MSANFNLPPTTGAEGDLPSPARSDTESESEEFRIRPLSLLGAFLRRDWSIAWSYRTPFFFSLIQTFGTLVFIFFLGRVVGHTVATSAKGGPKISYFSFAVIGTVLLALFNVSLTAVATQIRMDQTTGTLEILFTMPTPPWLSVVASATYRIVYASVTALVTLLIAALVFRMQYDTSTLGIIMAVGTLLGTIAVFCSVGLVFAAFVVVFKRGEVLAGFVAAALSVLGGVFYSVNTLPPVLRVLGNLLPFTWAVNVFRGALLTNQLLFVPFIALFVFAVVAFPLAIMLFDGALRHARRHATLAQY
jgi:ABC-type multidrug transport system permease subunit